MLVPARRDAAAARRFFTRALRALTVRPHEVLTDAAPVYRPCSTTCCPRRGTTSSGTRTTRSRLTTVSSSTDDGPCADCEAIGAPRWSSPGTPSWENLRRGYDGLATDVPPATRLAAAFTALAPAI